MGMNKLHKKLHSDNRDCKPVFVKVKNNFVNRQQTGWHPLTKIQQAKLLLMKILEGTLSQQS